MDPDERFLCLDGNWTFYRNVKKKGEKPYRIIGSVFFSRNDDGSILYQEECEHKGMKATKEYRFVSSDQSIEIYYQNEQDNRLFLSFPRGESKASHLCGEDLYEATWELQRATAFSLGFVVKGPKKEYTMVTEYRRDL